MPGSAGETVRAGRPVLLPSREEIIQAQILAEQEKPNGSALSLQFNSPSICGAFLGASGGTLGEDQSYCVNMALGLMGTLLQCGLGHVLLLKGARSVLAFRGFSPLNRSKANETLNANRSPGWV